MNNMLLEQLVEYSYLGNTLNLKKVNHVIKLIGNNREYLKKYVKALKKSEKSRTVLIDVPIKDSKYYKDRFKKIFLGKKIIWNIDPTLLLGIRITENDNILEVSLNKSLENFVSIIQYGYD